MESPTSKLAEHMVRAEEIFRHLVCWKDMTVVTGQIGWLLNLENRCLYTLWEFLWAGQ